MDNYENIFVIQIGKTGAADQIRGFLLGFLLSKIHPGTQIIFEITRFTKFRFKRSGIFDFKDLSKRIAHARGANRKLELLNYPIAGKFNFAFASLSKKELSKFPTVSEDAHGFSSIKEIQALRTPLFLKKNFAMQYLHMWPEELTREFSEMFSYQGKDPKQIEASEKIKSCPNSICIHVRRGDYINYLNGLAVRKKYFYDAIEEVMSRNNWHDADIFVFSNDWKWARENLQTKENIRIHRIEIFDEGYPCDEMEMMKACNAFIRSAGGFCLIAHFLSDKRGAQFISPSKHDLIRERPEKKTHKVTISGPDEKFGGFKAVVVEREKFLRRIKNIFKK
jgi:hypothetical protein